MIYESQRERDDDLDRFDDGAIGPGAKSIAEIIDAPLSPYTGSEVTKTMVETQIKERWGEEIAKQYDPYQNVRTFKAWLTLGRQVKGGEHALKSMSIVEKKDKDGKIVKAYRRPVFLFHILQTEEIAKS
jgi:hypothetical protein